MGRLDHDCHDGSCRSIMGRLDHDCHDGALEFGVVVTARVTVQRERRMRLQAGGVKCRLEESNAGWRS